MKEKLESLLNTCASYLKIREKTETVAMQQEQIEGQEARNLDGMKLGRVKPSGSGLNKKYIVGGFCLLAFIAMYSIMLGAGKEGSHISRDEETKTQAIQVGSGNHLRNVPANYTDEAIMEQDKKPAPKAEKPQVKEKKEKAVQPRPMLPRRSAKQGKPKMTLEQQERMEEYEAMKKAYQSPIKFELRE